MDYDLAKGNQPTSPFIARNNRKRALQDFIQTQGSCKGNPFGSGQVPSPAGTSRWASASTAGTRDGQPSPNLSGPTAAVEHSHSRPPFRTPGQSTGPSGTERDRNELEARRPISNTQDPQGPSSQRPTPSNHPTGGTMQPAAPVTRRPQASALHVVGKGIFEVKPATKRLEVCKRRPLYRVFAVFAKLSQNLPTLPSRSMPGLGFRRPGLPRSPADRLRGVSRERGGCCGPYWR